MKFLYNFIKNKRTKSAFVFQHLLLYLHSGKIINLYITEKSNILKIT